LPEKFGFAVDCGERRVLAQAPADIRIERGSGGSLIVRADGAPRGRTVSRGEAIATALSLAEWFVASGGAKGGRGRMAAHVATTGLPHEWASQTELAPTTASPEPGIHLTGALVGLAFGQVQSATLTYLASLAPALRMTPWRMVLLEGLREKPVQEGLVTRADDPMLRVITCTGAPGCPEAHAETRTLAASLAPHLPENVTLHVSGCAKGCAHPGPSEVTLVGAADGFALVRDGSPRDVPAMRGLTPAQLLADPRVLTGAR
jgi:precorrin-3B synthase